MDYINDKTLFVVNAENHLHFWSMKDYKLIKDEEYSNEILSISVFENKENILIEQNDEFVVFNIKNGDLTEINKIQKESTRKVVGFIEVDKTVYCLSEIIRDQKEGEEIDGKESFLVEII